MLVESKKRRGKPGLLYYCILEVKRKNEVPYLSAYTAHSFALKIRAKSCVRDIRQYPLSRAEFEYCAGIYRAQYTHWTYRT